MSDRPVFTDRTSSRLDIALEIVAILALAGIWGMTFYFYPQLPESIPRHFGPNGEPDRWGSKSGSFILPIIAVAMYVSLTAANRFPHRFNYHWPITEQNARSQYALARQLLTSIKATGLCIFAYITWARTQTALGSAQGLGRWFGLTAGAATFAILIAYFVRARVAR